MDRVRLAVPFTAIRMHEDTITKSFRVRPGVLVNMFPYPSNPFLGKPYEIAPSQEYEIRKELEAAIQELEELRPLREEVDKLTAALKKRNDDYTLVETKYCKAQQLNNDARAKTNKTIETLQEDVSYYQGKLERTRKELKDLKAKEQRPEDLVQNLSADLVKEIIISSLSRKRTSANTSRSDDHDTSRCTEVETETDDDDKQPSRPAKKDAKKRRSDRDSRDASSGRHSKRPRHR